MHNFVGMSVWYSLEALKSIFEDMWPMVFYSQKTYKWNFKDMDKQSYT